MAGNEALCEAMGSNCVMSEPFQSTTYTRTTSGSNYGLFTGDQSGDKLGLVNHPVAGVASVASHDTGSNTFAGNYDISTDSAILALLPNRDPVAVARFLATKAGYTGAHRWGYAPVDLGSTVKRLAMRWYSYHSTDYAFHGGACTNGKILHSGQPLWGSLPRVTFQSYNGETNHYEFLNTLNWVWTGHASFDGIVGGHGCRPGAALPLSAWRGKWYRHEFVVRRPRNADAEAGGLGFDFQFFTKNVTDDTDEIEEYRFSSGCQGNCLVTGGPNFDWNTGTYPTEDMPSLHSEFYRAGTCAGWQGWIYAMVAKWDTDTGSERIGAASEVEGGGGGGGHLQERESQSMLLPSMIPGVISVW